MHTPVRRRPYIGITGFSSRSELDRVLMHWSPPLPREQQGYPGRDLMVGILASEKSLNGIPVRRPFRYPPPDLIEELMCAAGTYGQAVRSNGVFSALHYHSSDPDSDLLRVAVRCGLRRGHGMQLNIAWPNPERVRELVEGASISVILQVGRTAIDAVAGDSVRLAARLAEYGPYVDYYLLDMSGGTGRDFDAAPTLCQLTMLIQHAPWLRPVVAGGLGPGALAGVERLLRGHPRASTLRQYLSVDAENGLRDGSDLLDLSKCAVYLEEAVHLLG